MPGEPLRLFAIAPPGLERLVAAELRALGEQPVTEEGGASWEGDARSLMRANLWLRTASRVIVRVARFTATEFYELERRAKKIPWSAFLRPGAGITFRVTARKSRLYHSDAIAQRLAQASGRPATDDGQLFVVRVVHDVFEVSADSSGDLLHMRGYRQATGKAPLRETLAAALLLAADWMGGGERPLLDPFCGSGTIPIEGALLARRLAPGLRRRFAFERWPGHDADAWTAMKSKAVGEALPEAPAPIHGSDRDEGAVSDSRANAERAGVAADIAFSRRAVSDAEAVGPSGLIAANPPYGKRIVPGRGGDVRDLYARFGQVCRERFRGWHVALYTPDPRLAAQTRLPLGEILRTSNGGIRVLAMHGPIPE